MKLYGEVVVSGGCGAIGSRLVHRILQEPEVTRLVVVDDMSAGFEWLLTRDPRGELCRESILDDDMLFGHNEPQEPIVFHCAAHFANGRSLGEPEIDTAVNVEGTVRMLEWAKRWKARHFVFASAGCAAGHEDTPYQVSKAAGEAYCRLYYPSVPSTCFRFHNSYGPGEVPGRWRNVVPNFMWSAIRGRPLTVHGDGTDRRDFVFVDDLVRDLVEAEPSLTPREIGTGTVIAIKDLAALIVKTVGSDSPIEFGSPRPPWAHRGRPAEVPRNRAHTSIEEGLARTYAWFQDRDLLIAAAVVGR